MLYRRPIEPLVDGLVYSAEIGGKLQLCYLPQDGYGVVFGPMIYSVIGRNCRDICRLTDLWAD